MEVQYSYTLNPCGVGFSGRVNVKQSPLIAVNGVSQCNDIKGLPMPFAPLLLMVCVARSNNTCLLNETECMLLVYSINGLHAIRWVI